MDSTSSTKGAGGGAISPLASRRGLLTALILSPWAVALSTPRSEAKDYGSAVEVFDAIDGLEADVAARLRGLAGALPQARAFVASLLADHERHRSARASLRRRLGLAPPTTPDAAVPAPPDAGTPEADPLARRRTPPLGLDRLRTAQEALVYAHAEGLPALDDPSGVDVLAGHMVDLSRHLTVIDLWIDAEGQRG